MTSEKVGSVGGSPLRARILSSRHTKQSDAAASSLGSAAPGSKPAGVLMVRKLAEESFILADDRQLDELRSAVTRRREGDPETAEVEIAHRLHGGDESLAGEVGARTTQPLDEYLGGNESFQAGERVVLLAGGGFELCLIFLYHMHADVPGEGDNLRDGDAATVDSALLGERLAADE